METTDYCSYELSKALKVAGFDEPCYFYYTKEDAPDGHVWLTGSANGSPHNYNQTREWNPPAPRCSAPTLCQAQKWLREKNGIAINIIAHDGGKYDFDIEFLSNTVE